MKTDGELTTICCQAARGGRMSNRVNSRREIAPMKWLRRDWTANLATERQRLPAATLARSFETGRYIAIDAVFVVFDARPQRIEMFPSRLAHGATDRGCLLSAAVSVPPAVRT